MLKLIDIDHLSENDIYTIWENVTSPPKEETTGNIAWSFEGNGIRTRTTFLQGFQNLGLNYVELPNFLKTGESAADLAGYMDPFFDLYVVRDSNHARLQEFADETTRPVINAMSGEAHPCEVLTDGYYLESEIGPITSLRILLWGPLTNVFKSWYALSGTLGLKLHHYCPLEYQIESENVAYVDRLAEDYDVLITDGWPAGFSNHAYTLSESILRQLGDPVLIPTPPVTVGNEINRPVSEISQFAGYRQKELLLPVQEEIIRHLLLESFVLTGGG